MSKQGNKVTKASISDFLAKKLQKEQDKNKTFDITISSMSDKSFTVKKPSDEDILNFIEELGDTKSTKKVIEESMKLFYRNCPDLQDPELHEALEVKDPYDTINVLFDFKDKNEMIEQFNKFIGFKPEKIDEEIKK